MPTGVSYEPGAVPTMSVARTVTDWHRLGLHRLGLHRLGLHRLGLRRLGWPMLG